MITTYGSMPKKMPDGFFKAVRFPVLALLDTNTGDGRLIESAGIGVRDLPLSIRGQFKAAAGHEGADITGALFEVSVDPETKIISGRGFLLDDEYGRRHARMIQTGAMRGNSVDLAEIEAQFDMADNNDGYLVRFTKAKLAATTGVATPAFAAAYAEVDEDDEVMASLMADPMQELEAVAEEFTLRVVADADDVELTADATMQVFEHFYIPEADVPTKIIVDENRRVYGHLGLWDSCHSGSEAACIRIPRPNDNYASFNKPGVLTDRGIVETGPIFAFGGHRPAKSAPTIEDAYGGIENAWADVRIIEGKHGPWLSGVVRPNVDDDTLYAVRASRISGHWVGGKLKAIVSVNAEGYDVPGSGLSFTPFAFSTDGDRVAELVASFPACLDSFTEITVEVEVEIGGDDESEDEEGCPEATMSIEKNMENREEAIKIAAYGPLNPEQPNERFWQAKADRWSVTIDEAKSARCGNCAAFIMTTPMVECITNGLGEGDAVDAVVAQAQLGYCEIFDFKCAATRTCDVWITGGPVDDASIDTDDGGMEADMEMSATEFAVNLVPPRGARTEAARGLRWVAQGHGGDGLEDATIGRARSMARGEARSPETVRRMRDYFNRHQSDSRAEGWRPGEDGYPSPGRVAWALWGGNAGWSWAKRTSDALDREAEQSTTEGFSNNDTQPETTTESLLLALLADE